MDEAFSTTALLGLTTVETECLLWSFNGGPYPANARPNGQNLASEVHATGVDTSDMRRDFGNDPGAPDAGAETPFVYQDLCEKLLKLTDQQALQLYWYIVGFWDGVSAGRGEPRAYVFN